MKDLLNLPNLSNSLLEIKKKTGLLIVLGLSTLGLTSAQLKPAEQVAIQAEILNSPSIVAAAKTEQKDDEAPDRGTDGGKHKLLEDTQTEDTQTKNLIIAGVRVRVKGEPTPPNDSKRRSFNIQEEKTA